jgi:DNA-binding winged helix-turn-helix (wHTH) protein/predicted esterase
MRVGPGEQVVTFGDYAFDPRAAILLKHGNWIRVPDQSLKVLAALLRNPGEVVTREELSRCLWPNGTHVEYEQGINSVVKRLRAALLDSTTEPRYIETLPKRGYRFIHPVRQTPEVPGNSKPLSRNIVTEQSTPSLLRVRLIAPLALLMVSACAAFLYHRAHARSWVLDESIRRATSLAAKGEYGPAYGLAAAAASRLPAHDPQLERLWPIVSRSVTIASDPSGATIFWRPYSDRKSPWRLIGTTPLQEVRVSAGAVRLRLSKRGYTDIDVAAAESKCLLRFQSEGAQRGMVHIPAGPLFVEYAGIGRLGPVTVHDFWIDRAEVTNSEYQQFVNSGGYQNPKYWRFQIIENGRSLSWNEAMAKFTDRTGSRSPAGWSVGAYPSDQGDYPVSGVNWYEAAAYASFAGKALPNVYQWFRAAHTDDSAFMISLSNFDGLGPAPVKSREAVGSFGAYDMAGNVREWCLNESGGARFILGGAWSDPTYMFTRGQKLPPLDRSLTNGFRCVRDLDPGNDQSQLAAPIPPPPPDHEPPKPASGEVYETSRSLYAYDRTDLHAAVESVTDSPLWRREKVRFLAGYPNQEVLVYLFLPKQKRPPYQCVVFVPSGDAFRAGSGDTIQPLEYVLNSGRALLYPILWGTLDRFVSPLPSDPANGGYPSPMFIREALIAWRKDLGRTLDYLQTRKDIAEIGYLGVSTGAEFAPVLLAKEDRVKVAVLLSGAMPEQMSLMPESNPINFAARITIPVLMLNGRYDSILTPNAQDSMFRMLGTAAPRKAHILVESGHGVFAPEVRNKTIRATLAWFDQYLASR